MGNMGQRMPDKPIDYGDDCLLAFDPDKTPLNVYARFNLMEQCPLELPPFHPIPPNDRVFKLTQLEDVPCGWKVNSGDWEVTFEIIGGPVRTTLTLFNTADASTYFYEQVVAFQDEGIVFHNSILVCQPWYGAHLGIAVVTWTPQATALLEAINLEKAYDLFMELRPLEDGNLVYKFCKLQDATNIKMLYDLRSYEVTGTLDPDTTGTYNPVLSYNDKRCYEITTTQWFLWWDGIDTWNISTIPGIQGTDFWTRTDPDIEGLYTPGGTATGDATVSLIA